MKNTAQKIWFLQLSRAFACLLIVYTHWYGIISTPNNIHTLLLQDAIPNYPNVHLTDYVDIFTAWIKLDHFNSVYFGLGLFFILSGYVIPLSLKNSTPRTYLIRRVFRIYPVLITCLFVSATVMTLASYYLSSSVRVNLFNPTILLSNALLIRDVLHARFIDNATWTLEIEMHFYLLFFIFFYFKIHKKMMTFIFSACFMMGLSLTVASITSSQLLMFFSKWLCINSSYLTFMFTGTTLYYMLSKQWPFLKGLLVLSLLLVINDMCLHADPVYQGVATFIFLNHLYALAFFLSLYMANQYIPYNSVLNGLAEISYPLYLTHGFTGYSFYFVLYHLTQNITFSAITALIAVLSLCIAIHRVVEKPAMIFSKRMLNSERSMHLINQWQLVRRTT